MSYVTQAALENAIGGSDKLIQLTNDVGGSVATASIVTTILDYANGIVAGYVAKRYSPSDAARSPALLAIAAEIGVRYARRRRGMPDPDDVKNEEAATKWLTGVADGTISLVDADGNQIQRSELIVDKVGTREDIRQLTRNKLKGFA